MLDGAAIVVLFVHLGRRKTQYEIGGPAVADHALHPAGIVPGLLGLAFRILVGPWNAKLVIAVKPFGSDKLSIGLLVVPEIRIAGPFAGLLRQKSRLDPAASR